MIVICKECGKKYKINSAGINGAEAKLKCKSCQNVITVRKPDDVISEVPLPPETPMKALPEKQYPESQAPVPAGIIEAEESTGKEKKKPGSGFRFGLRTKMFALFLLVPVIFVAVLSFIYVQQLKGLSKLITHENKQIVQEMAENAIAQKATSVANQCAFFLQNHPELTKELFQQDSRFKQIAVQKVGKTGYTGVYERKEVDGGCRTWVHVNEKIIGLDMRKLKKPLGKAFGPFWKIWSSVEKDKESKGYYRWRDADGQIKSKYAVCAPIQGTPYAVGATTYLDEFMQPLKKIEIQAQDQTSGAKTIILGAMIVTLILIGLIVSFYANSLATKIKSMTDTADRISVGELGAEINIKSKDEIGELANAISRMQESIRLSIQRLRRRR